MVKTRLPFANIVVVSDPSALRRILVDNVANYRKDRFQKRMLAVLSGGLILAEGDQWYAQRRILAPVFTTRSVRTLVPAMMTTVNDIVARWRERSGEVIDVAQDTADLALTVLERTIFSSGFSAPMPELREAMRVYFDALGRIDPFDLLDLPDFIPRVSRLSARPAIRLFHRAVDDMVVTRQHELDAANGETPQDILSLLIRARDPQTGEGLTQQEIRANAITLLSAGQESTADAISWALYLLSRSPSWRERVRAEAERELDGPLDTLVDRLVETRAVIDETLRLYPPLAAISRMAIGPDTLAGAPIDAGAMIVITPYVLHRHHRLWGEHPDVFDPGKFLPGAREQIDRFAYLPFGGGARGCIGSIFALQEATLAVAAFIRNFDFAVPANHDVWPVHRITLRPGGGLPMRVETRQARGTAAPVPPPAARPRQAAAS
ncbi:MAG TPA: cytochrome P450 [Pseudolabrys sp.]|nr:cytochrome P450 [Pseudolabrys sp.]